MNLPKSIQFDATAQPMKTLASERGIGARNLFQLAKWSLKDKYQFFYLLGNLLNAELGIIDSLHVLKDQFKEENKRAFVHKVRQGLEMGASFSDTLDQHGQGFQEFDSATLKMGEETGKLGMMMKELASYYQKRIKLRRKLIQAFSYPLAVIGISILVLLFMLYMVVPMFEDIFKRFDAELPWMTEQVVSLSTYMRVYGWVWLILPVLLTLILFSLSNSPRFRLIVTKIQLFIPLVGPLTHKIRMARFSYSLGLLLQASVNLDKALCSVRKTVSYLPLKNALEDVEGKILQGEGIYQAMSLSPIFPSYFLPAVKVGEQTARLDELLLQVSEQLEEESQAELERLTQMIEPLLIILVGGMVATILVAMYLPMFKLGTAVM
ncbi:MAG: type II secretion system F family protein [Bacteroidota bacterium]